MKMEVWRSETGEDWGRGASGTDQHASESLQRDTSRRVERVYEEYTASIQNHQRATESKGKRVEVEEKRKSGRVKLRLEEADGCRAAQIYFCHCTF